MTRYSQLREILAAGIASQQWKVGEPIPTEAELARTHGVAIGTVRKAIDLLIADGLVDRVQGSGTFVRRPTFSSSLFRFFRTTRGDGMVPSADSAILSCEQASMPVATSEALLLPPQSLGVRLRRLRFVDGSPILYEEIWLPAVPFSRLCSLDPADFEPLLYPLYERLFGIVVTRAREHLSIDHASPEVAAHLDMPAGSCIALIERVASDQSDRPVEWRRSSGAGSRFRYEIDIR